MTSPLIPELLRRYWGLQDEIDSEIAGFDMRLRDTEEAAKESIVKLKADYDKVKSSLRAKYSELDKIEKQLRSTNGIPERPKPNKPSTGGAAKSKP